MSAPIELSVSHRLGEMQLEAAFRTQGRLTALFGRSGSGKTSLVNIIAGLVRPESGRVAVDGRVLVDTESRTFLAPYRRRLGYVFQEHRLFPHLSVRQNLLYGRWFAPRAEPARSELSDVLDMLGIGPLLERDVAALSGGEKQRVAIGRALLAKPRLLLMDEPLAALDAERKAEIMPYIERLRDEAGVPIVYVSHSIAEVARLASDLVVLEAGKVKAAGPTGEVMARLGLGSGEATEAGTLVEGVVEGDAEDGLTRIATPAGPFRVPRLGARPGAAIRLRIPADDVMLALSPPDALSALNVLPARIVEIAALPRAGTATVLLDCGGVALRATVTEHSVRRLGLSPGIQVHAVMKAVALDPP